MNLIKALNRAINHPSLFLHVLQGRHKFNIEFAQAEFKECLNAAKVLYAGMESDDLVKLCNRFLGEMPTRIACNYAVCHRLKPEIALETGVGCGYSTGYILQALSDNGMGKLYSIDLPNVTYRIDEGCRLSVERQHADTLPRGMLTGFAVPQKLRRRWDLKLGDAKVELPKLLENLGRVDFFHHDSMHTYEHMTFEYETIWPYLRAGGAIASDDVDWNNAFLDFCRRKVVTPYTLNGW